MIHIKPEDHHNLRRHVHKSHRQIHVQPVSAPLHVITVIFNPQRYQSRYRLYHAFEKHIADAGAILTTVEIALRDRHHEVTQAHDPRHIQLRTKSELWFKENGFNVGMLHLPADWQYVAFVDADFTFTRSDWATETVQMLQHYDAVQMFKSLTYLDNTNAVHNSLNGFAYNHLNHPEFIDQEPNPAWSYAHRGAVGGAWAFRRTAFEKMQQTLLDRCILGSADWHMAFALAMRQDVHPEMKFAEIPGYVRMIQNWKERASALRGNIGYCDTHAVHHWHGTLKNRGYGSRWQILTRNGFDPYRDITYDFQGLIELSNNQTKMAHQIRAYFASRNEDGLISD